MRTLLHLGGAPSQVPAIKYALQAGYKIITCDYLPDNPGHAYSHEYYNVSTTDIHKIHDLARSLKIDGIASFASDPAAPTVGYVAERLGLPGPGEKAAKTLADKGLFRKMMKSSGLRTPNFQLFDNAKDANFYLNLQRNKKQIIKPVDSSGSKGISTYNGENSEMLIEEAFKFSRKNEIIIEDYIYSNNAQIQGEGFVISGELVFLLFGDQKLSAFNQTAPASTSFPSMHSMEDLLLFEEMVRTAIRNSGFDTGGLNIEIIQDISGHFHLLELGPRNGGNFMPYLVKHATGIDLVHLCIDSAMGVKIFKTNFKKILPCTQLILHSSKSGKFVSIGYKNNLQDHLINEFIYKKKGDPVVAYRGSQDVIGVSIFDISGFEKSQWRYLDIENHIQIVIDE